MQRVVTRRRYSQDSTTYPILHRNAITAADKLASAIQVSALTAVTESGSTLANSAFNCTVSAGNRWGQATVPAVQTTTPSLNQALRATIAQVTNAEWYDIFLSTAANPLWVGRITEAQRAAGGFIISTVGTVTAGGGASAGQVDLGIAGTGLASNVNPFLVNNAYTPQLITGVTCGDYEYADVSVKVVPTDLRSLPTCVLAYFMQNGNQNTSGTLQNTGDWHFVGSQTVNLLTATLQPLEQQYRVTLGGAQNFAVLVDAISGQGTSVSVWVDLE